MPASWKRHRVVLTRTVPQGTYLFFVPCETRYRNGLALLREALVLASEHAHPYGAHGSYCDAGHS